ncbi:bifunctional DNA primase/polymerase [Saccharopolyspora sp. NPDC050642]|uniref:bifunctional DNA primase/polymerase n=1 Tax=Saccharopolyspora sp. NPDC050642 TaxID=3157099 RepID=UPI0033F26777
MAKPAADARPQGDHGILARSFSRSSASTAQRKPVSSSHMVSAASLNANERTHLQRLTSLLNSFARHASAPGDALPASLDSCPRSATQRVPWRSWCPARTTSSTPLWPSPGTAGRCKHVPVRWADRGAANGMDVFRLICADAGHPVPLDTFTVTTPSGGTHLYFTAPADRHDEKDVHCEQGQATADRRFPLRRR